MYELSFTLKSGMQVDLLCSNYSIDTDENGDVFSFCVENPSIEIDFTVYDILGWTANLIEC